LHNAKKKKKDKKELKPVVPTEGQKVLRSEIDRLHAEIANWKILDEVNEQIIDEQSNKIEQLKNDIIGYRAVISYLQGQLDGVTV
jgi:tRNA A37 N6-isopentenylltransferase MiaA